MVFKTFESHHCQGVVCLLFSDRMLSDLTINKEVFSSGQFIFHTVQVSDVDEILPELFFELLDGFVFPKD